MPPPDRQQLAETMRYFQGGMALIAPMLALGALGYWLDRKFGTGPWIMVAGLVVGMIGGFVNFFQAVLPPRPPGGKDGPA
ncbi:MAG TPA: AtpZ/AtpI family protein [Candidatus Polarisedimenticolia bacterium]|nr:AtpZ/AtpI family protein [Candidatus Polarisedimenticolia bacterium]